MPYYPFPCPNCGARNGSNWQAHYSRSAYIQVKLFSSDNAEPEEGPEIGEEVLGDSGPTEFYTCRACWKILRPEEDDNDDDA